MGRFLSVCFLVVGVFLIWFSQYSDTSKLVRDIKMRRKLPLKRNSLSLRKT